jgi:hypothetical protein
MYFNLNLVEAKKTEYCNAIGRRNSAEGIFAFTDGTQIPICRPSQSRGFPSENIQRQVYSVHRRVHCLVFQGICKFVFLDSSNS